MCSSPSSSSSSACGSSFFLLHNTPSLFRRRTASAFTPRFPSPSASFRSFRPRYTRLRLTVSLAEQDFELSWFSQDPGRNDDYGGWVVVEPSVRKERREWNPFVIGAFGTPLFVLLSAIAYVALSRKGFKFRLDSPLHSFRGISYQTETNGELRKTQEYNIPSDDSAVEGGPQSKSDAIVDTAFSEKREYMAISVPVDSVQEEALSVLKKLKIVEDDVKARDLCTRREYARWLVRSNSLLERNPKHQVIPSISLSGSATPAFDDVSPEDPDFRSIQALAESGIIRSKLSRKNTGYDDSDHQGNLYFYPERYLSRQDLIDWKAQLEYEFVPGILQQISTAKLGLMDLKEISSDASPQLFMDISSSEKGILRKVFGQIKRFQPKKPSTNAQVGVTLVGGRMAEAISVELSRMEAESSARYAEMEDIKSELLERGDIQRFWNEKFNEEKGHYSETEKIYLMAISNLEEEKTVQKKVLSEYLREKAAIDCQRQLLVSLKEEVDEMTEKLESGRAMHVSELLDVRNVLSDLQTQHQGILGSKSVLESEKEAIRILRSWVEDEARKTEARAKVLEEVARRWKWDNQA